MMQSMNGTLEFLSARGSRFLVGLILAAVLIGCDRGASHSTTFSSAESATEYVKKTSLPESGFVLAISDAVTFAGQPDTMGAGMALVLDAVLAKGFFPDGFDQKDGYRVYRYKKAE
jgi:hypothetical protein